MRKIQLLLMLEEVWRKYPELRFGQLVENIIISFHKNHTSRMGVEDDLWNWSDMQWMKAVAEFEEKRK